MDDSQLSSGNDDSGQSPDQGEFLIVGIGASAGGIQALKEFFAHVPGDSGMAYVVILHLSPDHDSRLAEILQAVAPIPVIQVTERVRVQPDHVYVVPPNQHLVMMDGLIAVTPNTLIEERRAPVDIFFRTLAESHRERAVAVVLSGTGANGSMGIKRVKEKGGAAFVQNPREAEFSEMPRNSIATDLIDDVLNVAEIPQKIIAYKESLGSVQIPVEAEARPEDQQQALREIFTHLRVRTGHDFSNYKRPTVLRRIERRIGVRGLPNLPSYAAYLREHPEETQALLKDLLISVTNFFRDHKAFEALEQDILPQIVHAKRDEEQIRVWVAGCATGEEAYSMAMLLAERTLGVIDSPKVQIFATDIDETAIATAREGLYTINDAADVSPERLRRFFTKEGEEYRIRREIREMVLFANHNVLKDPPFSHLDLVTCRNMLIYLNQTAQERVMETFHFALNPGAYLFLGNSETVDGASDLYAAVNREQHIYQSRPVAARSYPVPESVPTFRLEQRQPQQPTTPLRENGMAGREGRLTYGDLHQQLLEGYAPPSIVVNEEYDIVHISERAGRYLQIAGGELSKNLLTLIRPELRLELRSALYQAVQRGTNVEVRKVPVRADDRTETINLHVRPIMGGDDPSRGFILVLFEQGSDDAGSGDDRNARSDEERLVAANDGVAQQLEAELMRTKAQLRTSSERYEIQAEEFKASNEELQALNEELRSAAEELETSKEELQSINEELRTVNQELKVKIEEEALTSNNLQNLINSTDIGTVFLDREFRVRLFSPAARGIFNLIPTDYGRSLSDITHRLEYAHLSEDAETVLQKLQTIEHEVRTVEDRWYMMRVLPYRTADDRIGGVVVTFVDITERKRAGQALAESEEKYRTLFNSIDEGVGTIELIFNENEHVVDYLYLEQNPAFERLTGLSSDVIGQRISQVVPDLEAFWFETFERVAKTGEPQRFEHQVAALDRWFEVYVSRIGGGGSRKIVYVYNDITSRKRAEERLQRAHDELEVKVVERTRELAEANVELHAEVGERATAEGRVKGLLRQLIGVQEDERRRIARELHDTLGQQLAALQLSIGLLASQADGDTSLHAEAARMQKIFERLNADVDFLAWELRPASLDTLGLDAALQTFVREWAEHFGVEADYRGLGTEAPRLSPEVETNLYRILQEALQNVHKHAGATHVSVLLEHRGGRVQLIVEDNGRGYDAEAEVAADTSKGMGVVNMRERAALVGGELEIESTPGVGTTIFVRVPFGEPESKAEERDG